MLLRFFENYLNVSRQIWDDNFMKGCERNIRREAHFPHGFWGERDDFYADTFVYCCRKNNQYCDITYDATENIKENLLETPAEKDYNPLTDYHVNMPSWSQPEQDMKAIRSIARVLLIENLHLRKDYDNSVRIMYRTRRWNVTVAPVPDTLYLDIRNKGVFRRVECPSVGEFYEIPKEGIRLLQGKKESEMSKRELKSLYYKILKETTPELIPYVKQLRKARIVPPDAWKRRSGEHCLKWPSRQLLLVHIVNNVCYVDHLSPSFVWNEQLNTFDPNVPDKIHDRLEFSIENVIKMLKKYCDPTIF